MHRTPGSLLRSLLLSCIAAVLFGPQVRAQPVAEETPQTMLSAQIRTLDQFIDIMRNGTDLRTPADGNPILQVMPWPVYGKMSNRELAAIYEYLKAIPLINPRPAFCTVN